MDKDKAENRPFIGIQPGDPNTFTRAEVPLPAPPTASLAPE